MKRVSIKTMAKNVCEQYGKGCKRCNPDCLVDLLDQKVEEHKQEMMAQVRAIIEKHAQFNGDILGEDTYVIFKDDFARKLVEELHL